MLVANLTNVNILHGSTCIVRSSFDCCCYSTTVIRIREMQTTHPRRLIVELRLWVPKGYHRYEDLIMRIQRF
jgi:hypothetical protein